ncbi:DUF4097 family beta strand repeat-containing protein [Rubrivirga litoralis]|uniref:DUF4097 family beta strand repeat-containing protein n=1 Tax=Rubrivirga litoralis TaxID=3075598 RepID=A0ABU3BRE7_9BACT|nr:DUF4097 family beta strand repeat-containing protein [Rubrivirga sp. F394]MDT0631864.1 DUF4097 family beta strand repeat-containing protein [Rubrivirga sp. F394]
MPTPPRPRFQRLALLVLGALLVALGADRLAEAAPPASAEAPAAPPALLSAAADELFRESFDVRPGDDLVVDLGSEAVVVETGSGDRALVTVEGRGRDARREFERRRFTARATRGRLDVRTDPPRRGFRIGRTDAQFTVTVRVPERFNVSVDVGSGAVRVGPSLRGDLLVDTGSGAVRVGDVTGGRIEIETGSGAVRAGRLVGNVSIDTGSGAVAVGSVDGPASIDTGSGAVSLTLASAAETEVDTGSGSVSIVLARGAGFDVELDGGRVSIDDALDFRGRRERREVEGTVAGGGPRLTVDTGSGAVRLRAQ